SGRPPSTGGSPSAAPAWCGRSSPGAAGSRSGVSAPSATARAIPWRATPRSSVASATAASSSPSACRTAPSRACGRSSGAPAEEERLEPEREARPSPDLPHREEDAGHEALALERVVADRQGLTHPAQDHLLVGYEAGQANGVDRHVPA